MTPSGRRPTPAHARRPATSTKRAASAKRAPAKKAATTKKAVAAKKAAPAKRAAASKKAAPRRTTAAVRSTPARSTAPRSTVRATAGGAAAAAVRTAPDTAPRKAAPRHLEVVGRPSRRRLEGTTRARVLVGGGALIAVTVAFALVLLHIDMAQRQFQLDRLSGKVTTAQTNYSKLRLQVAQLEAPQRIVATAEGKLGMRQPASVTYLTPSSPLPPGTTAAGTTPGGTTAGGVAPGSSAAPAGDADWPQVQSQLAGSP